jgi:hypothetical protein
VVFGGAREPESASTSIHKWYIDPLMEMKDSQGFLVLMVLLPLYEMGIAHFAENKPVNAMTFFKFLRP